MKRRALSMTAAAVLFALTFPTACAKTGSNHLTCTSNEVAPNSQPGKPSPKAALDWFLANGNQDLPKSGYRPTGKTATRAVYAKGPNQISVTALPTEKGQARVWVVTMTYDCK